MAKKLKKKDLKKTMGGKIIRDKDGNLILVGDDKNSENVFYGIEHGQKGFEKASRVISKK